jgi:hypothetical protein
MAAAGETPAPAVVTFVSDQIVSVLGVDTCEFQAGSPGSHPRLNRDGSVTRGGSVIDVDRSGFPTNDVTELVVESHGRVFGRFVMVCATRVVWPTLEQRLVAVTLAEQAGAALAVAGPTAQPADT